MNGTERLEQKLDTLLERVAAMEARQRRLDDLIEEMRPISGEVMRTATERLADLEARGYFEFGRQTLRTLDKVVQAYDAAELERFGDSVVGILDTVRTLTQPDVLALAAEAGDAIHDAEAEPAGLLGMLKASRDDEVRQGMGVLLAVLRHVGRGAAQLKGTSSQSGEKPRRRRALPPELGRPKALPAPAPKGSEKARPQVCSTRGDDSAFVEDWSQTLAQERAAEMGIVLTDAHWEVMSWARKEYAEAGASPNIRRVTQGTDLSTRDMYRLFPKAPAKTMAYLAGLPKPGGCI